MLINLKTSPLYLLAGSVGHDHQKTRWKTAGALLEQVVTPYSLHLCNILMSTADLFVNTSRIGLKFNNFLPCWDWAGILLFKNCDFKCACLLFNFDGAECSILKSQSVLCAWIGCYLWCNLSWKFHTQLFNTFWDKRLRRQIALSKLPHCQGNWVNIQGLHVEMKFAKMAQIWACCTVFALGFLALS